MYNFEASPNPSSTPSSVHGQDLPPPGELDQLRRVRIIADGKGFILQDRLQMQFQQESKNIMTKICTWSLSKDQVIQSNFKKKTSSILSCILAKARSNGRRPGWLESDYWDQLIVCWQSSEFQKKSEQTKATRKSKKGGSLHTCGSVCTGTAKRKLVWKKTHIKIRDGKEVWFETRAEATYNRYVQAIEELKKNRPIDDQGNPIMLLEEETLSCWLDVVGGVYKGRAYGLCSKKNFHHLQCGLQGIGGLPPCQMNNLRRCDRMFGSFLGSTRRNEKKEG
ncbi:hypothetical protein FXO38_05425 [Capsicum annuum]|nr:hypothetical protein FXO38_05425 [Capsicum annuum]